ncbi:hypothetical protein D3C85_1288690 [compost metagenome]
MQVAPQQAPARVPAWPQHAARTFATRPPEVQAGDHQHHAPAGSQLHQAIAGGADHQFAMQGAGDGLQVVLRVLRAEQLAAVGVDEHV